MEFRPYDCERDRESALRVWREIGWAEAGDEEGFDLSLTYGNGFVAEIEGSVECIVTTCPGTIRYLEEDLPFSIVGAVTTSRIARKQRLASRLTALAVASDAAEGALVSGLGMFEQGYYDQLGFGTGSYEHWVAFDPADLVVNVRARVPRRITKDDWEAVHASRLARVRGHGSCSVIPAQSTHAWMMDKKAFGVGYFDGPNGELTHHLWIYAESAGQGPYGVNWAAWQNGDQFLELLAFLKSLGDQVHLVRMNEPPGIQLQDLLRQPFKRRDISKGSKLQNEMDASAYWQVRICDLPGCMARTHIPCADTRFNLRLEDPIESFLEDTSPWRGVAGEYVVTLGHKSHTVPGTDPSLPTLSASVGAFTRMWFGVRPASGLAITDQLSGPPELLRDLDRALLLPEPHMEWGNV